MGFRTIIALNNDQTSEWSEDPELGRKIMLGMTDAMVPPEKRDRWETRTYLGYGTIIECAHADTQRLLLADGYSATWMPGTSFWQPGQKHEEVQLKLLREAADALGFTLVRKPPKVIR